MPIRWNVPRHAAAQERLDAALSGAARGAVVLGPDGVGKSTLARLAAERRAAAAPGTVVRWVTGTPTERAVPFGAFSHLIEVAEIGKPAALLRAARASLVGAGEEADLLLVVDDAHELDLLSATLVYQLALAGAARMVVSARPDAAVAMLTALWTDALLERIDLTPPAGTTAAEVDEFLAELPAPARAVVDYLAVAEPLLLPALAALAGADAVELAERFGAAETRVRGGRGIDPVVYSAHPLFTERALAALGADGARARRTEVLGQLPAGPDDQVSDRLRRAVLAVGSTAPQPVDEVVAAAGEALRLGALRLAEQLAESALERGAGLPARLVLATALGYRGRGRDADAVLAAVDPAGLSEAELLSWALPRAANQFFGLGEPERATAFLQSTRRRLNDPCEQITLDALAATFAMNAGNLDRAVEISGRVLAAPEAGDTAVAWAGSAAALCAARQGRFEQVGPMVQRALGAEHPGLLRFTVGLAEVTTLILADRLDEALELAQQFTDFAELQQPGRAIGEVLLAEVLLAGGQADRAAALLGPAAAALERTGYSWGPLSLMLLATALARGGDVAAASKALSRAESRHGTKSALFTPELGVARAWQRAAMNDRHGAVLAARDAARMAERAGQRAVALRAWREAVRLGDRHAADPLARLDARVGCAVGAQALAEARALAAGQPLR
ncbi:AAA family ATPase [Mycobacterium sp. 1274756.6]|uniref:AAA family ATPase n=1 Tax=Mycobacterium sp. 1274756.6 TaxID=1834076 RepID=UPI000801EF80|nr:AAA family ATPase [Mycobacterium sp. 1274756.6]OBJ67795.1 AAA family ATPase [Mycobacterium sp. 1274756.6]